MMVYRIVQYAATLWIVVTLNFFLIRSMPVDPLVSLLGERNYYYLLSYSPEALNRIKAKYHLDEPLHVQYTAYLGLLMHADLGWTYHYDKPVLRVILSRLESTLVLLVPALVLAAALGGLSGAYAGWKAGTKADGILTAAFLFMHSIPGYCLGMVLVLLFSYHAGLFPLGGMVGTGVSGVARLADRLHHLILPLTTVALHGAAGYFLVMRSAVQQIANDDYIVTALGLGLHRSRILLRHMAPNALPPLITAVALGCGRMVGGVLLIELVFSWHGMGTLVYEAVGSRDYPLLSGCLFLLTVCVIAANALADLVCAAVDPRVKDGAANG